MLTLTEPAPLWAAVVASAFVAVAAWRLRGLTRSGAAAATLVGTCALAVSWGVGCFLIAWFVLATVVSRVGKQRKAGRVLGVVEKGGQRDAAQVFANGGVFCLLLLILLAGGTQCTPDTHCGYLVSVAAAGSLAAAGADTWATEFGTLFGGTPFSTRTLSRVAVGTSGAVTLPGTMALLAGAVVLAFIAAQLAVTPSDARTMAAVVMGGTLGAVADTLIGAWMQERRRCPLCATLTEQRVHQCGTRTVHHAGISGLNNDVVNFLCASVGAAGAVVTVLL
ncbi:MAG: DUF92 domain-containing protein [Phycisphaerae bacterium]|nr:DUF92 domain-containing protein [Gemmatimonadaceae bacterium]